MSLLRLREIILILLTTTHQLLKILGSIYFGSLGLRYTEKGVIERKFFVQQLFLGIYYLYLT